MARSFVPVTSAPTFETVGELAHGGMATVSIGRLKESPDKLVAIKRIHQHLAKDSTMVGMFLDEIRVTGAIDHPNIVQQVSWGVDDKGPFLVTELIEGLSLAAARVACKQAGEAFSDTLAAYIGAEVAHGLDAAYTATSDDGEPLRIVHRDLTPGNVLLSFSGEVSIADFGVAKTTHQIMLTQSGTLKGKAGYMAPEYIRGGKLDGRSDLYSLGIVMYELLSGRPAFEATGEIELLQRVMAGPPAPLAEVAGVDEQLADIVHTLCAFEPEGRYPSSGVAAAKLDEWLEARGATRDQCRRALGELVVRHGELAHRRFESIRRGDGDEATLALGGPPSERGTVVMSTKDHLAADTPSTVDAPTTPMLRQPRGDGSHPARPRTANLVLLAAVALVAVAVAVALFLSQR